MKGVDLIHLNLYNLYNYYFNICVIEQTHHVLYSYFITLKISFIPINQVLISHNKIATDIKTH